MFNKIGPAHTIDSLFARAIYLALPIALKVEFSPAKPDIAATKISTFLLEASIIALFPEATSISYFFSASFSPLYFLLLFIIAKFGLKYLAALINPAKSSLQTIVSILNSFLLIFMIS